MAMNLRLPEDVDTALESYAAEHGMSKHEAIVRAVKSELERSAINHQVDFLVDEALAEYAGLLERLAQ